MKNILVSGDVAAETARLVKARETWERTLYKQSNDALYELLAEAFHLFTQVKGVRSSIRALNQELDARGITYNSKTSLAVKIARCVFGDCGNRVFVFARVFSEASRQKIDPMGLPKWIESQNGIENIRSGAGKTASPSASQLSQEGAELCSSISALFVIDKHHRALEPHPEADNEFSVALVRTAAGGKSEIVFGCNKKSVVNAVLSEAARSSASEQQEKRLLADVKNAQKAVHEAVESAVSNAGGESHDL